MGPPTQGLEPLLAGGVFQEETLTRFCRGELDAATFYTTLAPSAYVFHAAGLVYQRRAVLICGPSGYGKTTVSEYLRQHGLALFSDDCCVVDKTSLLTSGFVDPAKPLRRSVVAWLATHGLRTGEPSAPVTPANRMSPAGTWHSFSSVFAGRFS